MGGLGPGVGGFEILVIGLVALLVVGPKDLPMLMRKVGQFVGKARGMANEFRASFDEMARQSELDDLRKEVEALRSGQGMHALGAEAEEAFKDIRKDLEAPLDAPVADAPALTEATATAEPQAVAPGVDEWPDVAMITPDETPENATSAAKPRAKKTATSAKKTAAAPKLAKAAPALPKTSRARKVDP